MRATTACSRGLQGEASVDYFGEHGRVRGTSLFATSRPERLRFDIVSPFGVTLSTVTSDGSRFALLDVGAKQFFRGPASDCNVTRFLRVPVPAHALVSLLGGEAPVLVHRAEDAALTWTSGSYVVGIRSRHGASQEIHLTPTPADWDRPWQEQRLRVTEVRVVQQGIELYRAELDDHRRVRTARPRIDPDGIDPPLPPSGPTCDAEVPGRVHLTSEASADDVVLVHRELLHNPPLPPGLFQQSPPAGVKVRTSTCL